MDRFRFDIIPVWIPDWLLATAALAMIAGITALLLGLARKALRRIVPRENTLSHSALKRAGGVAQLALTMLATSLVSPVLGLDPLANQFIERILFAGFIVLVGWAAIVVSNLAMNRYIARIPADQPDNLLARKTITQMRLLKRSIDVVIVIVTTGLALMTFDAARQIGISLFASAGIAGLAIGFAAKPLLENLVAGIQLAITQPFRIDDVVIVQNEWGRIEEINATYVVIRCWDWRRLIVPLSYMMTTPFQNWTRQTAQLIGTVMVYVDYAADIARLRRQAEAIVQASPLWDGYVVNVQVSDVSEASLALQLRVLASASDSAKAWDLRCEIREKLIAWMRSDYPEALPRQRAEFLSPPPIPGPV